MSVQLQHSKDDEVQKHAKRLFGEESPSLRSEIVDRLLPDVAKAKSDVTAGKAIFEKRCAVCHRLQEIGKAIGAAWAASTSSRR